MQKVIICLLILFKLNQLHAQSVQRKSGSGKQLSNHKAKIEKSGPNTLQSNSNSTYTYQSNSQHNAYSASANTIYTIQDPVIRIMNLRANGSNIKMGKSGIIGESKKTYGLANGHLIFYSEGATSSGTITGSGSVGTGSSPGSIGINPVIPGVNGKSTYAGPSVWGTAVTGSGINIFDSSEHHPLKKKNK